jgi:hypothetical protein
MLGLNGLIPLPFSYNRYVVDLKNTAFFPNKYGIRPIPFKPVIGDI